ncbi:hypothetical protein [Parahalioglobus pacificus]|uniref:hypothetical protein n=1 Tax=Parahalioglobus pacificus TaxID=930806 RepID=UPI0016734AE2|nr:hypothetical protein [Halioglobus pacificus]
MITLQKIALLLELLGLSLALLETQRPRLAERLEHYIHDTDRWLWAVTSLIALAFLAFFVHLVTQIAPYATPAESVSRFPLARYRFDSMPNALDHLVATFVALEVIIYVLAALSCPIIDGLNHISGGHAITALGFLIVTFGLSVNFYQLLSANEFIFCTVFALLFVLIVAWIWRCSHD